MPVTPAAANVMLDAFAAGITAGSLHTAQPDNTGSSELAGGTPAYARLAITWNAASGANLDSLSTPVFDVPASTITHAGVWAGATFYGWVVLSVPKTFTEQGQLRLADIDFSIIVPA